MEKEQLTVIKIGGNIIDDVTKLETFIQEFKSIEGKKILIHGGGKLATRLSEKLGITTQMIEGRRVTDKETIDVVTMVYGGLANKQIVARLQAEHVSALGITGADGDAVFATKRPLKKGIDYGFVGDVKTVNIQLFETLLSGGFVPVVAPITHNRAKQLLNTNADTMATEIAIAMSKQYSVTLMFTFELNGVMKDMDNPDSLIKRINQHSFEALKQEGAIHSGMIPKLDNAFYALASGIQQLYIGNYNRVGQVLQGETDEVTLIQA